MAVNFHVSQVFGNCLLSILFERKQKKCCRRIFSICFLQFIFVVLLMPYLIYIYVLF